MKNRNLQWFLDFDCNVYGRRWLSESNKDFYSLYTCKQVLATLNGTIGLFGRLWTRRSFFHSPETNSAE